MSRETDPYKIVANGMAWARKINDITLDRTIFARLTEENENPDITTQANLMNSALKVSHEQLALMYTELAWRLIEKTG